MYAESVPHRFDIPGDARYLTFSCYKRLPLFSNDRIKNAFVEHLSGCRDAFEFQLLSWVVMPEHVHVIVLPDIDRCPMATLLRAIKEPFARNVLRKWRRLNARILTRVTDSQGHSHFWQRGGGFDRNIRSHDDLFEKMRYIHANPVRRGLVDRQEEWVWSSARSYMGIEIGLIGIDRI